MADKKALTWTELRVGVVVLLSLIVLAGTILYIGSGSGSPLPSTIGLPCPSTRFVRFGWITSDEDKAAGSLSARSIT